MSHLLRPRRTMLFIGTVITLLLLLLGVFTFKTPGNVHAEGSTLFVGQTAGSNTGCASPGFTSVQAAVDAANIGNTVYLCGANSYVGPVIITKAITLTGDSGASIQAPPTPFPLSQLPSPFTTDNLFIPQAIVTVWGTSSNATITNLTIAAASPGMPGNGSCAEQEFGVLVIAGGTATLSGDQVKDIRDSNSSLYGCQFGVGIQVGREYWPSAANFSNLAENFVGHATITGTTVSGYQKNGITIDGPGTTADVSGNTVNGAGRDKSLSQIIAQNGIQVSRGASAQVRNNTVTGNSYTGSSFASSGGILIFGGCGDPLVTGVQVMGNTLLNNDVGVYLNNLADDCVNPTSAMTNDKAVNNTISNNAVTNKGSGNLSGFSYTGYQAGIDDIGTNDKIINNTISGVGYTPPQTTQGGPFVVPIDTISSPTNQPRVHANNIH